MKEARFNVMPRQVYQASVALMTCLMLVAGLLLIGCATQTPEERSAKYIGKGDAKMEQAMGELKTADDEYLAFDSKSALKSFDKALDHIDDAIIYYVKAVTTPDQKAAVSALEDGLNEMEKCVKALQDNDTAKAEKHYLAAQSHFDDAEVALWSAS
jgi:outer membrane PBP1 activator LpoA protein